MDYSESIYEETIKKEQSGALIRIIDDEISTRRALGFMLQIEGYSTRVYNNGKSFLDLDNTSIPGCIILDVRMPQLTGLQLQREILRRNIKLPIIFVTGYADIDVAVESMRRGAIDFLIKPVESEKLLHAIQWALHADHLQRHPSSKLHSQENLENSLNQLTQRERDVVYLFASGLNNQQVAARLGISERTVEGHRLRIYKKFAVHSDDELMLLAQEIHSFLRVNSNNP